MVIKKNIQVPFYFVYIVRLYHILWDFSDLY